MRLKYIHQTLRNAPDFKQFGFLPLTLLTEWGIFRTQGGKYISNEIDMSVVRQMAAHTWWDTPEKQSSPIVFNVETLPVTTVARPHRDYVHDQMRDLLLHYRTHPKHHYKALGFYAQFPVRDFWRAIKHREGYDQWQEENKYFLNGIHDQTLAPERGLSVFVDRVYPSLYYWYPQHLDLFPKYADENLKAAATYNKPIIAYVSPNVQVAGFPYWEKGVWRDMLSYVWSHPLVDGVCVFQIKSSTEPDDWNNESVWWKETLEVLA
jgi:hypothetical protein